MLQGKIQLILNWFQPCLALNVLSYFLESLLLIKSWKSMLNMNFEHFGSLQWRTVVFFQSKRDICVFKRQRKWFSVLQSIKPGWIHYNMSWILICFTMLTFYEKNTKNWWYCILHCTRWLFESWTTRKNQHWLKHWPKL